MTVFRSSGYVAKPANPLYSGGVTLKTVDFNETITAAENENGDIWVLAGPLSYDDKIVGIVGTTPAFTSATDNDIGFYKSTDNGVTLTAIDKDILVDGADLSSALTFRELLRTLNTSLDTTKTIGEHLGVTSEKEPSQVYLCLTMNTASSATSVALNLQVLIQPAGLHG